MCARDGQERMAKNACKLAKLLGESDSFPGLERIFVLSFNEKQHDRNDQEGKADWWIGLDPYSNISHVLNEKHVHMYLYTESCCPVVLWYLILFHEM